MHKKFLAVVCLTFGCAAMQAMPQQKVTAKKSTPTTAQAALQQLDEAAKKFRYASADFTIDQKQTKPLPDEEVQTGNSAFLHNADGSVAMAAHFKTNNGAPQLKDLVYDKGQLKMYEPNTDQLTVFTAGANKSMYESFLTLGFGGNGTELEKNWNVTYAGTDKVGEFEVVKLDLVSKISGVRDTYTKVTLWLDLNLGVSRRQLFLQKDGGSRTVEYTNIQVNKKLPGNAFTIKTKSTTKTQQVTK